MQANQEELMKELKFLGSCSRCGIALQKSKKMHFVSVNKKARWEFPVQRELGMNLPWDIAVGVLCDGCASKALKPFWAVELRGDSVYNYTMVELEDSVAPDKEMETFMRSRKGRFSWREAPNQLKQAVQKFLSGEEMPESELSLVRWYIWQWVSGLTSLPRDVREKISFLEQDSLQKYVDKELKQVLGIDPFS
ncbi:MAG: hypothetical protein QXV32_03960 [Conexivisphaerales archaeon]